MPRRLPALSLLVALLFPTLAAAETPYLSRRVTTPEDTAAIAEVVEAFRLGIIHKDGPALSNLVLDSDIMFTSPGDQARVDAVRAYDPHFNGIGTGGFGAFARYISTTQDTVEEKFHNVEIVQDGPVALVTFDYEFYGNGKLENYGLEHWQMRKTDGRWKIFSVIWTQ